MKKILLLTYAISPDKGSEYSVAWNYIINMSKKNQLTVIYGTSGDHLGETKELEEHIMHQPVRNVKFIPVKPTKKTKKLNSLNERGIFVYSFYFAFNQWHKQVFNFTEELTQRENFDIIHYLTPIGYREPGYLWKLNLPYIWGPIGGTNNPSIALFPSLNFQGLLKLCFRSIANTIQLHFSTRIRTAIKTCDVLLTSTRENKRVIDKIYKVNSIYCPENGITTDIIPKSHKTDPKKIKLVWIGRIDSNKSLITLLKALTLINDIGKFELHVVGDGYLKEKMQNFANAKRINNIIVWHGKLPRNKVFDIISHSDLHIITSLSESNTTVIWETLSLGIPTLTLDHCGMGDVISDDCGIKISINSYSQVIRDIAQKLNLIAQKDIDLDILSKGATQTAQKYTWEKRIEFFDKIYTDAIKHFELKQHVIDSK